MDDVPTCYKLTLAGLSKACEECVKAHTSQQVFVYGPPGYGKTHYVERIVNSLPKEKISLVWADGGIDNTRSVTRSIVIELQKQDMLDAKALSASDLIMKMNDAIITQTGVKDKTLVLVLDGFTPFAKRDQPLLYRLLDTQHTSTASVLLIAIDSNGLSPEILEKRVRSRFRAQIFFIGPPDGAGPTDKRRLFTEVLSNELGTDYDRTYKWLSSKDIQKDFERLTKLDISPRCAVLVAQQVIGVQPTRSHVADAIRAVLFEIEDPQFDHRRLDGCGIPDYVLLGAVCKQLTSANEALKTITLESCWSLILSSREALRLVVHELKSHAVLAASFAELSSRGVLKALTRGTPTPLITFQMPLLLCIPLKTALEVLSDDKLPTALVRWATN